jgi:hypothetical protein
LGLRGAGEGEARIHKARRRLALLAAALLGLTPAAATAQVPAAIDVPTAGGYTVHVEFSAAAGGADPDIAAAYVGYLDSLPHGTELGQLTIQVAAGAQVPGLCGGVEQEGILACYSVRENRMTVPNAGLDATTNDGRYSLRYVLTHEYGHHIAHHRRNPGFRGGALDWGPKLWASYELVCARAAQKLLFPGDEGIGYRANPGENWAETYARLTFPEQPWNFSPILFPDAGALDAARRDVLEPWTGDRTAVFTMANGRRSQRFSVPLTLDGVVTALIRGPRRSQVGVRVSAGGRRLGASKRSGRTDSFRRLACRRASTETLSFTTIRKGSRRGPVQLAVSYPG